MARPRKWRRVCCMPGNTMFGPIDANDFAKEAMIMTVDQFEAIRLIDVIGLTQEECAEQMNVARTTVQGIYDIARKKLGDALVNGKTITIEGGSFQLCDGSGPQCGRSSCRKQSDKRSGNQ